MTGGAHAGNSVGEAIRKGVGMVHGAGEGIRGNVNAAVDSATGDHESAARNEAIASRGADEMDHGYHRHPRAAGPGQADQGLTGSTNYGSHPTNVGNKMDPRYDSDVDHRGTAQGSTNYGPHSTNIGNQIGVYTTPIYLTSTPVTVPTAYFISLALANSPDHQGAQFDGSGSTNYGPHSTNFGNKADPRYDSDLDHRGTREGSTNFGPHSTNIGNKLDPHVDSDMDHRGAIHGRYGSSNYGPHPTNIGNKLDPRYDSDLDHRGTTEGSTNHGPHHTNIGNKLDPHYDSDLDHRRPGTHQYTAGALSTYEPTHYRSQPTHCSSILNALDPRVDSDHARRTSREEPVPRTSTFGAPRRADTNPVPHLHHHCPPDGEEKLERYDRRPSKSQHAPHSNRVANVLDPRVGSVAPLGEPHSAQNPHQSQFLNLLDPRVDSVAAKKHRSSDNV
ncbi:hypothetical protein BU26DRAFT_554321 [Trematosphaeria pertusa]|uniref:Uncharacterized protein n=1 Tax=Trematosphaeria pertusa TaxID=390896 RepID=A0A6A6I1F7_9PLEO|nr:uncharacterized protein BU26DRAFT_554321 [Trematosphaeria pertusa]KAF2244334.1 hypothetical protein BU26DRAFT_554321 [Trematosphaeria pertusa]